jgi:hypothetical protein
MNLRQLSRRIGITHLRQHYHPDFGSLWQNVTRRLEKSPRGHDLTPVAVSEKETEIRLWRTVNLNGRSDRRLSLRTKKSDFIP